MKAWTVLAITKNGEFVGECCLKGKDEHDAFHDKGEPNDDIGVLFASNAEGDEVCGRCGQPLA